MGRSFSTLHSVTFYLFEDLGVFLLSATKIHCKIFPNDSTDGNLSTNVSMGKRQAPRCGLSLACVRQQCHWRSEYPECCSTVEYSSLYDSEKKNHHMYRSATVDYVRPFSGMHRQAGRGILHFLWGRNFRRSLFCWHRCSVLLSWRPLCEVGISVLCKNFLLILPLCGLLVIRWCIWRSSVFAARLDHVQICEIVFFPLSKLWCWESRFFFCECLNGQSFHHLSIIFLDVFPMRVDANNHTLGRDNELLLCSWSTDDDVLFQTDFVQSFWHIVVLLNRLFSWLGFLIDSFCFSLSLPCHARINIARAFWHSRSTLCALFFSPLKSMLLLLSLDRSFFEKSIWFAVAVRECN